MLADLIEAAADSERPYPPAGLLRGLCRAAIASGGPANRDAAVALVEGLGDPTNLPLFLELQGEGPRLLAGRAYLGEASSLEEGLAAWDSFEDASVRTRLLEALLLAPRRALPECVARASMDASRADWLWAAACVARLGSAEDRRKVLEIAAATECDGTLLSLLSTSEHDSVVTIFWDLYNLDIPRPVQLAFLSILAERASSTVWRRFGADIPRAPEPFSALEASWPRRIWALAGARCAPFLEAVARAYTSWFDHRICASALRTLVEGDPELAAAAVHAVADNTQDAFASLEAETLLLWAGHVRGSEGCRVAGDVLVALQSTTADQRRAVAILAEIGGDEALVQFEVFFRGSFIETYDERVLVEAIRACEDIGGTRAYDLIATMLVHLDDYAAPCPALLQAVSALTALGPAEPRTVPILAAAAASSEISIRRAAVESLLHLGEGRADARDSALAALQSMEPEDEDHARWIAASVSTLAARASPDDEEAWTLFATYAWESTARLEAVRWLGELPRPRFARALWTVAVSAREPESALAALRDRTGLDLPAEAAGRGGDPGAVRRGTALIEEWAAAGE